MKKVFLADPPPVEGVFALLLLAAGALRGGVGEVMLLVVVSGWWDREGGGITILRLAGAAGEGEDEEVVGRRPPSELRAFMLPPRGLFSLGEVVDEVGGVVSMAIEGKTALMSICSIGAGVWGRAGGELGTSTLRAPVDRERAIPLGWIPLIMDIDIDMGGLMGSVGVAEVVVDVDRPEMGVSMLNWMPLPEEGGARPPRTPPPAWVVPRLAGSSQPNPPMMSSSISSLTADLLSSSTGVAPPAAPISALGLVLIPPRFRSASRTPRPLAPPREPRPKPPIMSPMMLLVARFEPAE